MNFFKNNTVKPTFSAAMTFGVRNQLEKTKLYCHCLCHQETFLNSFYPCRLQMNKGNFFKLSFKFVTVREIAEPKVTVFTIYVFGGLQEMFLTNFYPSRLPGK